MKRKRAALVCAALAGVLLHGCVSAPPRRPGEAAAAGRYFRFGVSMYDYHLAAGAEYAGMEYVPFVEEQFRRLSENNIDTIHFAISGTSREIFPTWLEFAEKYDIMLAPQLDFAYWYVGRSEAEYERRAAAAAAFIAEYNDHPRVIAFSVREELGPAHMGALLEYYARIREQVPEARFWKLHNNLAAMRLHEEPNTVRLATDRYAFWWEFSGGGYTATPGFSLSWLAGQAASWRAAAGELGHDEFWMWVNTGTLRQSMSAERLEGRFSEGLRDKVKAFAADGRFGWQERAGADGEKEYVYWKYYRTPENCTRAQVWLTVAEGLSGFFVWSWSPTTERQLADNRRLTLAGRPGEPNFNLDEIRAAAAGLKRYDNVIRAMRPAPESPLTAAAGDLHVRGFSLPGLSGRLAVAVNTAVGEWPGGSRRMFRESDEVYIDDEGNLLGYEPFTADRACVFERASPAEGEKVFDLASGAPLEPDEEGLFSVDIAPGGGRFLFAGTPGEFALVRALLAD